MQINKKYRYETIIKNNKSQTVTDTQVDKLLNQYYTIMAKLKYLLFALIFFTGCEQSVWVQKTPADEGYYKIVNGTDHHVQIKIDRWANLKNLEDHFVILPFGSVTKKGERVSLEYRPFPPEPVYLIFDDTLLFRCDEYCQSTDCNTKEEMYGTMFYNADNYKKITERNLYRYEITEEDYEYAKAHPYNE